AAAAAAGRAPEHGAGPEGALRAAEDRRGREDRDRRGRPERRDRADRRGEQRVAAARPGPAGEGRPDGRPGLGDDRARGARPDPGQRRVRRRAARPARAADGGDGRGAGRARRDARPDRRGAAAGKRFRRRKPRRGAARRRAAGPELIQGAPMNDYIPPGYLPPPEFSGAGLPMPLQAQRRDYQWQRNYTISELLLENRIVFFGFFGNAYFADQYGQHSISDVSANFTIQQLFLPRSQNPNQAIHLYI